MANNSSKKKTTNEVKKKTNNNIEKKKVNKVIEEKKVDVKPITKNNIDKEQNLRITLLVIACLLLVIILLIVIKGTKVELSNGKEVVAKLDKKNFVAENIYDELKSKYGTTVLVNMVDEYIVSKEIKDNSEAKKQAETQLDSLKQQYESQGTDFSTILTNYGYENEEALLNELTIEYNKEIVAKKYIKKAISDDEINEYYKNEIYGDYNAKHILIKSDSKTDATEEEQQKAENEAKKKTEEVIEKLNNGEKWKDLVKKYSDDEGSVEQDGLIENFTKGDVVDEFFNSVIELKDGEYTKEPVKSEYGYHVILRVSAGKKPSLKNSKSTILDAIVTEKLTNDSNLISSTWVDIRKKYNFEIKDTQIKKTYKSTIKTEN